MTTTQYTIITNKSFLIFGEDFNRHPHALEHLLRPMFEKNQFIWVETIGLRSPKISIYDLKRILEKIFKWINPMTTKIPGHTIPKNINIVSPFMLPFNQFAFIRMLNKLSVNYSINKKIQELNFKEIITITSVPNAADYVGNYNEKLKIYYCVDEFSLWPGLDYKLVSILEKQLISKVDKIIATSEALAASKTKGNEKTEILSHGVDFNHFNIGPKKFGVNKLKICYFGLFDERTDQSILIDIALALPNVQMEIIGEIVCDISSLKRFSNISFLGKCHYSELPTKIKDYDIFILPYKINELTRNINPLKLKEYLSTSRLVISTPLPEVLNFKNYLEIANNSSEFISIISEFIQSPQKYNSNKTIEYIKNNETWIAKAAQLSNLIK